MVSTKLEVSGNSSWLYQSLRRLVQTSSPVMARLIILALSVIFVLTFYVSSNLSPTLRRGGLTEQALLSLPNATDVHGRSPGGESVPRRNNTDHAHADASVRGKPEQNQQQEQTKQDQEQENPKAKPEPTVIEQAMRPGKNSEPAMSSNRSTQTADKVALLIKPQEKVAGIPHRSNLKDRITRQQGRVDPFLATQQQREEEGYQSFTPKSKNIEWLEKYSAITVMLGQGARYVRCTHNLLDQIRSHGEWKGDIIMLEPENGFPEDLAKWRIYWEKTYGVRYRKMAFVKFAKSQNITLRAYTGGTIVWEKMTILTDSFFRKYAYIWWIDSDSEVLGPLRPAIDTFALDNGSFYGSIRFQGDHSLEWDKLSPQVVAELEPKRTHFDLANSFMIWKVRDIEPAEKLIVKMVDLLRKAGHAMKYPEQSLLSLMYWDTQQRLTVRYNVEENETCDDGMKHVIVPNRESGAERRAQKLSRPKWCQFPVFHDIGKKCGACEMPQVDDSGNLLSQANNSHTAWCSQHK